MLPLTVACKLSVRPESSVNLQNAIVGFLTEHHFAVTVTDEVMEYMPIISARSGSCQLRVARISPLGHEADLVRQATARDDRTFYVFRGAVYREQPVRRTVANYLWFRFLHELGLVLRVPPVLAVMSSCEAERLPWGALAYQQPT